MTNVQLTIRMDKRLKQRGDSALQAIGWTPSQAARALWLFAAENCDNPQILREECKKLLGDTPSTSTSDIAAEGWSLVKQGLESCGLDACKMKPSKDYINLRDQILQDRLTERDLL